MSESDTDIGRQRDEMLRGIADLKLKCRLLKADAGKPLSGEQEDRATLRSLGIRP